MGSWKKISNNEYRIMNIELSELRIASCRIKNKELKKRRCSGSAYKIQILRQKLFLNEFPVNDFPERFQISCAVIAVIDIIGMLPDITG
jgi:hypothetical protein